MPNSSPFHPLQIKKGSPAKMIPFFLLGKILFFQDQLALFHLLGIEN